MPQPTIATDNQRACAATTQMGLPCRARALMGDRFCYRHSPAVDPAERRAASARGGTNRSNVARLARRIPADLGDLLATLLDATAKIERGEITPSQATAMANLASAAVRIHEAAVLEGRLADLEAANTATGRGDRARGPFDAGPFDMADGFGPNVREVA